MRLALSVLVLGLAACSNASSPARLAASVDIPPASQAPAASTPFATPPAPAPLSASSCAPGAYRHASPAFCLSLPAWATAEAPHPIDHGIAFAGGLTVTWAPRSDTALVDEWKKPARKRQHQGPFEILSAEPMPRGSYFLVYDATQHEFLEIYKVPSVRGMAVVEGETFVLRCTTGVSLERNEDPRAAAAANVAKLDVCKSLRALPGA